MKNPFKLPVHISNDFNLKSITTVTELENHDMIYVYHHLKIGQMVQLLADGTNLKGDIRYKVFYKNFTLGYVYLGGFFKHYYESNRELFATVNSIQKDRYMPVKELDIEVCIVRLQNVS